MNALKNFYERTQHRFWDPAAGMIGRDLIIRPLLQDLGGTWLEYGCGAGSLLMNVARDAAFKRVIGVDISEAVLEALSSRVRDVSPELVEKIDLRLVTDDKLSFLKDGSVDVIVSVATIEHVLDPYAVLDELHRVARPGATLICSVPNYAYLKHRVSLLFGKLPLTGTDDPVENWRKVGWDGMHLHCFTQHAFDVLLRDTRWQPVAWTGWGDRAPWLRKWRARFPALLSGELVARCVRA